MLVEQFNKNPTKWSIKECVEIGDMIGMDRAQVSKWNWDHRKKLSYDTSRRNGQLNKSTWDDVKKRDAKADFKAKPSGKDIGNKRSKV